MEYQKFLHECYDLYFIKYTHQSKKTIATKKYMIDSFISSLPDDISHILSKHILEWQNQLHIAPNTLNRYLCVLRQFLLFSKSQGLKTEISVVNKCSDDYVPYLFSEAEIQCLMETADNNISMSRISSTKTFCFPMALRLLAYCGMRLSETLSLKWEDYDEDAGILILHNTKGDKERYVPLHATVNELLQQYKCKIQKQYGESEYLFPDNSLFKHITREQFAYEFHKIMTIAGIHIERGHRYERSVCLHCLRYTFAVNAFRKTVGIDGGNTDVFPLLSTYLGHERLRETEKYLKFSIDLFPDSIEAFKKYSLDIFGEV
jgi:integrase